MAENLTRSALDYHREPRPGKIEVVASKPLATQRDLSLAYSPGVAAACEAIVDDPANAASMTIRANLVAVVTNGTAVLGLGPIGPLAAKPVMEGKGVLFKKFAGIDVFDIEVDATEIDRFVDVVAALEPTFGAINLEDIKGPECFEIERCLSERMNIPVFHDDQHGTAIIVAAAVRNGLRLTGKTLKDVKLVVSGAGAAALACVGLLVEMGLPTKNITVTDIDGVVHTGRKQGMDEYKAIYAQDTEARTLGDVVDGADIFLGLSAGGVLKADMVKRMAKDPLILALANPSPEIMPDEAKAARPDAIVATGRSDYPNQVNNVLCFPFIFRGALDVGATEINREMKFACVEALADLAQQEAAEQSAKAYGGEASSFGREYLIPVPFDPRLIGALAPKVAQAAMDSGVATRPIEDFDAYRARLEAFVFRSGLLMKPIFARARRHPMRVAFAEGEDPRVLRAVQATLDESVCHPILIGRPVVIASRQGRNQQGLRDGSWDTMACPMLNITGSKDMGATTDDPNWKREPFLFAPPATSTKPGWRVPTTGWEASAGIFRISLRTPTRGGSSNRQRWPSGGPTSPAMPTRWRGSTLTRRASSARRSCPSSEDDRVTRPAPLRRPFRYRPSSSGSMGTILHRATHHARPAAATTTGSRSGRPEHSGGRGHRHWHCSTQVLRLLRVP